MDRKSDTVPAFLPPCLLDRQDHAAPLAGDVQIGALDAPALLGMNAGLMPLDEPPVTSIPISAPGIAAPLDRRPGPGGADRDFEAGPGAQEAGPLRLRAGAGQERQAERRNREKTLQDILARQVFRPPGS